MWALIDISTGRIVKFFLFYKKVKFNNITRKGSVLKIIRKWIEEKRKELQLSPKIKGEFLVKIDNRERSQQLKTLLEEVSNDFDAIYVDSLVPQGLPRGDTLIETLCDLASTTEHRDVVLRLEKLPLTDRDVILLRKAFASQAEKLHLPPNVFTKNQKGKEVASLTREDFPSNAAKGEIDRAKASQHPSLIIPDLVIPPNGEMTWLDKVGEELEEWVTCENDILSHRPLRESWTEAVRIKREIGEEMASFCSKMASSQEIMLEKQDLSAEKFQRLTDIVQGIRDHLQKRKKRRAETKPLRDEIKAELYRGLMGAPLPRQTHHAHVERARKRVVFALLCYTGARVNELRKITYNDLMGIMHEGRLKLILHKQRETIVRFVATAGQKEVERLLPDADLFFRTQGHEFLGESYRKPGQLMHEKAWISYINREIRRVKKALQSGDLVSSHSFRVGFVTRHLRHADSHVVARLVGHKSIVTTLRYNRYVVDEGKEREILDRGYRDQQVLLNLVEG